MVNERKEVTRALIASLMFVVRSSRQVFCPISAGIGMGNFFLNGIHCLLNRCLDIEKREGEILLVNSGIQASLAPDGTHQDLRKGQ